MCSRGGLLPRQRASVRRRLPRPGAKERGEGESASGEVLGEGEVVPHAKRLSIRKIALWINGFVVWDSECNKELHG